MVLAKDASDGVLQKKTKEFAEHLDDFLTELSESLRSGTYEPDPLLSFGIPKGTSGEVRTLHIPSIRDRVVERAVVNTITHRADLAMSPCSFVYRTGIGTDDAVDHLAKLRDAGYCYVLRTDIEDYFPNLNIEDALATLSPIAGCPRTIDLIRLIARPRRARGERRTRNRGIAQGSCLSPLLANLALTDVDRAMGDAGYGYARFADDIVICSPHEPDLLEALELLDSLLTPRGLRLNQEKTAMTSFDEGFCYLGTDFSRSFPPVDPRHDIKGRPDPDQVVYVGRDGARVHISQNRLIVDGADGLPQVSIPRRAVSRIVLTGAVGLSSGARSWALYNDIDVIFLSRHGGYLGQLAGPRSTASARRLLTQASFATDDDSRLPLARAIVRAKMRHQVSVLHRTGRRSRGSDVETPCTTIGSWPPTLSRPQTSTSSWGWRAPPQRPTSAACPDWSHRRSPSTDAAAAHPRTWPTPPSPTPTRSCWPSARALCWPPGSSPRSGCCTPPSTSVPASPWTSTRRARLAAALEGWGYRLQESVIQLRLEPAELDEMRQQITGTINQTDDVIHLYPLCDSCLAHSEVHGTSPALDDAGLYRGVW